MTEQVTSSVGVLKVPQSKIGADLTLSTLSTLWPQEIVSTQSGAAAAVLNCELSELSGPCFAVHAHAGGNFVVTPR